MNEWCVPGALCTYNRFPRSVLRVDGRPFLFNGQLCAVCRAWSEAKQQKSGPQGLYAVSALIPYGQTVNVGEARVR